MKNKGRAIEALTRRVAVLEAEIALLRAAQPTIVTLHIPPTAPTVTTEPWQPMTTWVNADQTSN